MLKIPKTKEFVNFSSFAFLSHYSITKLDILIFGNILHFEMIFGNLY